MSTSVEYYDKDTINHYYCECEQSTIQSEYMERKQELIRLHNKECEKLLNTFRDKLRVDKEKFTENYFALKHELLKEEENQFNVYHHVDREVIGRIEWKELVGEEE